MLFSGLLRIRADQQTCFCLNQRKNYVTGDLWVFTDSSVKTFPLHCYVLLIIDSVRSGNSIVKSLQYVHTNLLHAVLELSTSNQTLRVCDDGMTACALRTTLSIRKVISIIAIRSLSARFYWLQCYTYMYLKQQLQAYSVSMRNTLIIFRKVTCKTSRTIVIQLLSAWQNSLSARKHGNMSSSIYLERVMPFLLVKTRSLTRRMRPYSAHKLAPFPWCDPVRRV